MTTPQFLAEPDQYLTAATHHAILAPLAQAGIAAMLLGGFCGMFPLWKSATLSPDSIERRTYWTGCSIAVALYFCSALPDWRGGLFFAGLGSFGLILIAARWTSHIKINGKIYGAAAFAHPDRPPALAPHTNEQDT